jgi:predicted peptidase
MNEAINLTGQPTPSGNMPFLLHRPPVAQQSVPQPLIIFLHGAGEGSPTGTMANAGQHNATTVRLLERDGVGLMTLSKDTASLPGFVNPIDSKTYYYYVMAPQQYYPEGTSRATGSTWEYYYVRNMITWAKANLNIDWSRIYLTGLSLGGGGTVDALSQPDIHRQIAAAVSICPGYGHNDSVNHKEIAKSGVPLWLVHNRVDLATNPNGGEIRSQTIARKINALGPVRSPRCWLYDSEGHGIWYRMYNTGTGSYALVSGFTGVHNPNFFRWLLKYTKKGIYSPYYPLNYP